MPSPSKEDLPKVSSEFKIELRKFDAAKMKRADTKEKNPLPSREDVIQEKQRHELFTGVNKFNKAKLKRTNTKEKIVLPTKEVLTQEKAYDGKQKVLQSLTGFDRSKLKKTVTVVKNLLPTKEAIEQEKRSKGYSSVNNGTQPHIPLKEDLPKVSKEFKIELEVFDAAKMKRTDTKEKNLLPSKEDVIQEKQRHDLFTGVNKFNKAKLKRTNTKEKLVLPTKEVLTQEKVYDGKQKVLQSLTGFDRSKLRKTVTVVKNLLPTKEVIEQEKHGKGCGTILQGNNPYESAKGTGTHNSDHKLITMPSKEDLPKVSSEFKNELENFDAAKMKPTDTKEKNPLPSREDVIQEKQRHELFTGVNTFNKSKLKRTNTMEKIILPSKEVLTQEKVYDGKQKVLQSLSGFDRSKLRKTVTVVKNHLPTKEVIEQEKRSKGCSSILQGNDSYNSPMTQSQKRNHSPSEKDPKLITLPSPSKEDLPRVSKEFKIELEIFDAAKMNRTDTKEKNPLPTKEDMIQEKQRHELFTGVNKFNKAKLKRTNTKEKIVLPTKEVLTQEKVYDGKQKVLQSLAGFDRSKLRKTKTVVKNLLPTKEVIEQEKRRGA